MSVKKEGVEPRTILLAVLLVGSVAALIFATFSYWDILSDQEQLQELVQSFGAWAPLALLTAEILAVFVPTIPGQLFSIAGGYIYGTWIAAAINLVGVSIGALLAFFIARAVGRPFVEHLFDATDIERFDHFFHKHGVILVFLCRTQFFLPNDLISYSSGLIKRLTWKKYLIASVLGYIPNLLLLASVGEGLQDGLFSAQILSYALLLFLICLIYLLRKPIYRIIHKEEKDLEDWLEEKFS